MTCGIVSSTSPGYLTLHTKREQAQGIYLAAFIRLPGQAQTCVDVLPINVSGRPPIVVQISTKRRLVLRPRSMIRDALADVSSLSVCHGSVARKTALPFPLRRPPFFLRRARAPAGWRPIVVVWSESGD